MTTTRDIGKAKSIYRRIRQNVNAYYEHTRSLDEFQMRARMLWIEAENEGPFVYSYLESLVKDALQGKVAR
jgi:hypothetical protein